MFVLSPSQVCEVAVDSSSLPQAARTLSVIKYDQHLWKLFQQGIQSFDNACKTARNYLDAPPAQGVLPLIIEHSQNNYSIYLSDPRLKQYHVLKRKNSEKAEVPQEKSEDPGQMTMTFRSRPVARPQASGGASRSAQEKPQYRGLPIS